ncbi:hypothetical protein ACFP1I_28540 [Dyadobacter subterraneus]|uniref:Uncharacterized protein n=1 Tax=Dyadobacter subterraneus TaxID=2773304 RepID=A0ABR9WDV3_9BACT|nr:hypothetical protein [Dyadobacter subterraneus]MBE9463314.1 hypothetical protein [Dyadobacter subterraneus]
MENMFSAQEIEVVVSKEAIFTAETVVFWSSLSFTNKESFESGFTSKNKEFLDFLNSNRLEIIRTVDSTSSFGEYVYNTPVYQILLNHDQYLLLEKYRDSHPELGGMAVKPEFSQKDKELLLHDITVQAWREADEIAIKKGLVLKNEYKSEEIIEKKNSWVTGPPASARYDHFKQPLSATYKFTFKTL